MSKGLKLAVPPPRRSAEVDPSAAPVTAQGEKFNQLREDERVQFNKRLPRRVADGFEMLAIRTRRKVPDLLAEALELLEQRYGRV
jgi:hypothetical protein